MIGRNIYCPNCGEHIDGNDKRSSRGHIAVESTLIAKLDARAEAEGRPRHDVITELINRALDEAGAPKDPK